MIKLKDLNKKYGKKVILNHVNLEIPQGEIIGLLAPNAMGKSTLLKVLGGHICFDSGTYEFEGHDFVPQDKAYIGYMQETNAFPSNWKVKEVIDYYKQYFKTFNEKKCIDLLKHFNIGTCDKIKVLSKGQNEKFQVALCLSIEGSLYIMDEPLAAVDLIAREELIKMILNNFDLNTTIIISSHLVRDIEPILDRVWFLKDGKIVENTLVEDLKERGFSLISRYKEVFLNE